MNILAIHQIEMTSNCNLRCRYCPSPHLQRPKQHMVHEDYLRALDWAHQFARKGQQRELNLAGIGESTMHPRFVEYVHLAREAVGHGCALVLATNGLLITDELAKAIASAYPMVWVSMHRPEKAGPAVEILKKHRLLNGTSADPTVSAINWAGQVKWHVSAPHRDCMWVKGGRVMVMADGRVTRCCLDASGAGVICHVQDDLTQFQTTPYSLCKTCDQNVGLPIPEDLVIPDVRLTPPEGEPLPAMAEEED